MAAAVRQDLAQLMNSSGSHKDLAGKYRQILEKAIQLSGAEQLEALKAFVESMVNENVSLVISRQLLTDFCTHLPNLPDSTAKEIYHFTLEKIQPRVISFEEQVASIRQHLASIYEKEEDWRNAAQVLVGIPLETGQKQYNVDYKLETYLKIARLYLEDDDPVQAEAYINRASLLQNESTNEQLQIHYKVCYARVLDYRRKFIEAAQRYNELSYKTIVHESERLEALKHALHCTILASAGKQIIYALMSRKLSLLNNFRFVAIRWRRDRLPTLIFLGFPSVSVGKESTYNAGDLGLIPGLGRSPGEGKGYPLQYSGVENCMDYIVHGVAKNQTRWSDFHCYFENMYLPASYPQILGIVKR
uniref:COP9 signalosome subunit 4 n=1 Tax=Ovis aries TaxID=9940 RepID=A0AC11EMC3_SHEEP